MFGFVFEYAMLFIWISFYGLRKMFFDCFLEYVNIKIMKNGKCEYQYQHTIIMFLLWLWICCFLMVRDGWFVISRFLRTRPKPLPI